MRNHLPAIIIHDAALKYFTLVTACGHAVKRGERLTVREAGDATGQQSLLDNDNACAECLVRWDAAEEAGVLRVVWTVNGKTSWLGKGAVVFDSMPMPEIPKCAKCGAHEYGVHRARLTSPIAVVVREDRRPKVVSVGTAPALPPAHGPSGGGGAAQEG